MLCHYFLMSYFSWKFCFSVSKSINLWSGEQFEILQASLDIDVFPESILSSADVVQRILVFVVTERLPSVVREGSVLGVNHVLVRLVSILLLSLPSPKFLADLQLLHLLPEKMAIAIPLCLWDNRAPALFELPNLNLHIKLCDSPYLAKALTRSCLATASY